MEWSREMDCEKEELERDRKNKWMEVLQRERMSEKRKEMLE